jgi:hypothetical protein
LNPYQFRFITHASLVLADMTTRPIWMDWYAKIGLDTLAVEAELHAIA